ncbi:hypothetical protein FB451DRAFT_1212659 [Mycena latifolia]|nr:hypothetical protein FB451DRAFT_1212659 [Mycena latifolia]
MATEFDAVPALASHEPGIQEAHSANCDCITCIQPDLSPLPRLLNKAKPGPIALSNPLDFNDADLRSSSPPSTPSTGSIRSKRAWVWSDDDESSSDSEPDQKRVKTRSISSDHRLRLPHRTEDFLDFRKHPEIAFVDKSHSIRQFPDKFRYLLLRPPRFGKTTFLSTLNHYYDLHGAKRFTQRFGSLGVVTDGPDSVPQHSQHLCLSFDLSEINVHFDKAGIADELMANSSLVLEMFLRKYATELKLSDARDFQVNGSIEDEFARVFALIKACGYTLFVSVDAYDAPIQMCPFARLHHPLIHESFAGQQDIEHLLDAYFWGPVLAGADVIDKLFVTGTLPLRSPALKNLHMLDLRAPQSLQLSCGFTEQEAVHFVQSILDDTPNMVDLPYSCGGYVFPSDDDGIVVTEPLFHPQQTITWISKVSLQRPDGDDYSFKLFANILELLPEDSSVSGAVTLTALIDLLAAGAMEPNATDATLGLDATAVTWNTLYHAGGLTYDRKMAGTLRVANTTVLSLIHARVDTLFADRHDLQHTFLFPWSTYSIHGDPEPFLEVLSRLLRSLAQTSFGRKHEPNMRGVLELAMRNDHTSAGRVIDPIILLPDDTHTTRVTIQGYGKVHVWDLSTLTLLGIWRAANPNDAPTVEALQKLHEELVQEGEEKLLARPYMVWSPTLNAMETRLVGSFFEAEPECPQFLAVGGARVLLRERPILPISSDPCL